MLEYGILSYTSKAESKILMCVPAHWNGYRASSTGTAAVQPGLRLEYLQQRPRMHSTPLHLAGFYGFNLCLIGSLQFPSPEA
jgi:hypothetical protein